CINVLDNDIQARIHIIAIFMSYHFKRIILSSKQVIFLLTNFGGAFMNFNELLPNITCQVHAINSSKDFLTNGYEICFSSVAFPLVFFWGVSPGEPGLFSYPYLGGNRIK